jgi:hypothetical protein
MANVYAVKSGNWSDTTVWNTSALPTSADDVYSNNFTVTIDQNVNVLSLRNTSATGITAGGGYSITGNFTITAPNLIKSTPTLITYSGTGTININASIINQAEQAGTYVAITSNGNVNWVGNITNFIASNARFAIDKSGTGKLTFTGDITTGNIVNAAVIRVNTGDFEMTGNATIAATTTAGVGQLSSVIQFSSGGSCIITGSLINNSTNGGALLASNAQSCVTIPQSVVGYFKHIGTMINNSVCGFCLDSRNLSAINILTGPFICTSNGIMPFLVFRMNYQITMGSYFEFRDSSTNGALSPPSAAAPATRLVAPSTVVDAPIPANVRDGVSYALNTLTGTLKVPAAGSVALGVPVDNTTGTAVLTPAAVWDYATSSITNGSSIGARLKNCSTVDTTGEQLEALL